MAEEKKAEAAPAAPAAAAAKGAGKKGGKMGFIMLMIAFGAAVPFIIPTLFLLVGMLPTIVTMFTDNDKRGSSVAAVGAMNAAGLTPFVIDLWTKGQTPQHAWMILQSPETWLVMFGAAAVGRLILFAVPQVVASASVASAENRLKLLKINLDRLKTTWGPDVGTTKPLEKMMRGE